MSQQEVQNGGQPALRLVVTGRVQQVMKRQTAKGDVFKTLVKTPAPDAYSSPGTFEIRSHRRLGAEGSEITVECDLLGYARSYETKDGETVRTSEHVLQAS